MSGKGYVVVDGQDYAITRIDLLGGLMYITAAGLSAGHTAASPDYPATVFGADGQGVCQGWKTDMPALHPGQHVTIILPIRIDSLTNVEEP